VFEVGDRIGSGARILWCEPDGALLLGTDDGEIVRWSAGGTESIASSPLSISLRAIGRSRLASRLLRQGPRAFVRTAKGTLVWTAADRMWRLPAGSDHPSLCFAFPIGHGPLFMAATPDGKVYWGDYVARRERHPSCIYCSSDDGQTWQVVFRFEGHVVRHIHGIFWDDHGSQLWLTTGDDGDESALWTLNSDRPEPVASGDRFRIVQPVFTAGHVLFGMDVPGGRNYLCAMDRRTGKVEELIPTIGPVFFGHRAGSDAAFSTSIEPLHEATESALYVGNMQTLEFREVLRLEKDRWPMRLFQYGQLFLPQNSAASGIWFTPCATTHDGHLVKYRPDAA